jgi:Domain of unknown function DUF11
VPGSFLFYNISGDQQQKMMPVSFFSALSRPASKCGSGYAACRCTFVNSVLTVLPPPFLFYKTAFMRFVIFTVLICCTAVSYAQPQGLAIQWQKTMGGEWVEEATSILVLPDSSFVVAGYASSQTGDVTGLHSSDNVPDGWVVKFDYDGNIVWKLCIGGMLEDKFQSVLPATDGGYYCFGRSESLDGDLNGNTIVNGSWLVKLSSGGIIEWSKTFGSFYSGYFGNAIMLSDGNIALLTAAGQDDAVLYKLDPLGNIIWEIDSISNSGSHMIETAEKNILTNTGLLIKPAQGDTSRLNWNQEVMAMKKLDNRVYVITREEMSNKLGYTEELNNNFTFSEWSQESIVDDMQTTYATTLNSLAILPDGTAVIAGNKNFTSRGGEFNAAFLYTEQGLRYYADLYNDGGNTFNAIESFPNGREVLVAGMIDGEFWIARISLQYITGQVFFDINNNYLKDIDEPVLDGVKIKSTKSGNEVISTSVNGQYFNNVSDTGSYTTSLVAEGAVNYIVSPVSRSSLFVDGKRMDTINFAIHTLPGAKDCEILLRSFTPAVYSSEVRYKISVTNRVAETVYNKQVRLIKDIHLDTLQTLPFASSASGDNVYWNIDSLLPGKSTHIFITLKVGSPVPDDSFVVVSSSAYFEDAEDINPENNESTLVQNIVGNYCINCKEEVHNGSISMTDVINQNDLVYTIRFQNPWYVTANEIVIKDTLPAGLNGGSIEMVDASHPYILKIKKDRYVEWELPKMNMLDTFHHGSFGTGYLTYKIKPATALLPGDSIINSAFLSLDHPVWITEVSTSSTIIKRRVSVWTGSQDTAWENQNNWSDGLVPDELTETIIPAVTTFYPVINSEAACFSLFVYPSAEIRLNDGFSLQVTGKQP